MGEKIQRRVVADGVEKLVGVAVLVRQMSDFLQILPTNEAFEFDS